MPLGEHLTGPAEPSPGRRVATSFLRPERDVLARFHGHSASAIGDAMNRLGAMSGGIRRLAGSTMIGSALTVWVRSGDNQMLHRAIGIASPGDVLVVNGQGSVAHALFGELMCRAALRRGVAGLVLDGAIRDRAALASIGFPTFARGVCASGPTKEGTGEVGYPVACGGVVVASGDIVVGDADGVVVVPRQDATEVLAHLRVVEEFETRQRSVLRLPDEAEAST